jgi:hypothetical protein
VAEGEQLAAKLPDAMYVQADVSVAPLPRGERLSRRARGEGGASRLG